MRWKRTLSVVDCHAGSECGRVIVGGIGQVPGETLFDKRVYLEKHLDDICDVTPWMDASTRPKVVPTQFLDAMIRTAPPQAGHVSISMPKTRLRRRAQSLART